MHPARGTFSETWSPRSFCRRLLVGGLTLGIGGLIGCKEIFVGHVGSKQAVSIPFRMPTRSSARFEEGR